MDALVISRAVLLKIRDKHGLSRSDVEECFSNIEKGFLIDDREQHKTNPQTQWFIAENNTGKKIKIVFIFTTDEEGSAKVILKSAYVANSTEMAIYESNAQALN